MTNNYVIDFTLIFTQRKQWDKFCQLCDDMPHTVSESLEMDDYDEIRYRRDKRELQIIGTSDLIPGKRAFMYLREIPGLVSAELWYCGGDRFTGEVLWRKRDPDIVRHIYLPSDHRPEEDTAEKVYDAFLRFGVVEFTEIKNLWG